MRATRSLAWPLSVVYLVLVGYASLYPFAGWRWPPGHALSDLMVLRWLPWAGHFDDLANWLGYALLGLLLFTAVIRSGGTWLQAVVAGCLWPSVLSYVFEVTQHFLPTRVPSGRDWVLNTAGAIAVLGLWPVALLFPLPVPLGTGHISEPLRGVLEGLTAPWGLVWPAPPSTPLSAAREALAVMLGLLVPCLLALVVTRSVGQRLVMVAGAGFVAWAGTTLSTALNFSPDHALAWLTPTVIPAALAALALAGVLSLAPPRLAAALALVCVTALIGLVLQAPSDPYRMASLQAWEQGRFVRFHGLAQWVGWLWPHVTLGWLVLRLARRS